MKLKSHTMKKLIIRILTTSALFLCITLPDTVISGSKKIQQDTASLMQCKDPRPEMCIGQYKPVCAIKNTGVQCLTSSCLSIKELTYANACEACSDYKVVEYKQGVCSE